MNFYKQLIIIIILVSSSISAQEQKFKGEESSENQINLNSKSALVDTSQLEIQEQGIVLAKTSGKKEILLQPVKIALVKPEPFISSHLELLGSGLDHHLISIKYRFSDSNKKWSNWSDLPFEGHTDQNTDQKLLSSLMYLDKTTTHIQYAITVKSAEELILKQVNLKHYSPGATPKKIIEQINQQAKANQNRVACSKPPVVSRAQWGARPPRSTFPNTNVTHLIVHHEFGSNSSSDWAARVRSVQNFHMNSNGWSDVGYNFLIDPNGIIYEGRAGGDNAVGAHFCGRNQNTMGICMLGNYSSVTPKVATQNSLKKLLAWKADKENINPTGSAYHYSINGSLKTISGHRDGGGCSACPGNGGYAILPSIRTGVQGLINNGCSGGGGSDTQSPTTSITATGGNTQSGDFTANFNDNDNIGVTRRFYQALEKYGSNWYANRGNGFFNDNFNVFYSGYTTGVGSWGISNGRLRQSNTSSDNTKLSSFVSQNSGLPYLYEFAAKVVSTSGPRKFGIHIMADDVSQTQRGNSYLIWFSGEDNKVRIYETVNNVLNFRASGNVIQDNKWANYKITYSPAFGVLEIFKNNTSVLKWTDSSPIASGSSISLRTNKTIVEYDDLKVYKFRAGSSQTITAGSAVTKDIRRRNGKIKSLVRDAAGNWSSPGNLDVTISTLSKQNIKDDNQLINQSVIVYPNPSDGTSTILKFPTFDNQITHITIHDISGRKIKSITHKSTQTGITNLDIGSDISRIQEGQYLIKVTNSQTSSVISLIKQ